MYILLRMDNEQLRLSGATVKHLLPMAEQIPERTDKKLLLSLPRIAKPNCSPQRKGEEKKETAGGVGVGDRRINFRCKARTRTQ